ncbi:DUF4249 domain-containing protein [Phaeodactylibacter sp.]|jgi:hypothetical protein|uniref:DUF4249 domain-containing protein n=1 Tax=Phaeodactylibacter sp. TaxID=1940289 RepID=UPI00260114BB|nr:DUF4249 domain-containing protein [Phaeodactylibacter sp.]MCI4649839.1 DUF4249 domain-containing protein [Phaeodactylibacter sp.]MCI5092255.1 DUF4249 domain-containing protein [Phaeodactylibacter sp.]
MNKLHVKLLMGLIALSACNLEQEVEIDLPEYEVRPVLEAYVEPGERYRLLLTLSAGYFAPLPSLDNLLEELLLDSAEVSITHDGVTYQLENTLLFDPTTQKIYNYAAGPNDLVPTESDLPFELNITLPNGETIRAETRLLPQVEIDSVVIEFPETGNPGDTLARALTYFTDNPNTDNFYRRMLQLNSLDSLPEQDFVTDDRLVEDSTIAFGTGFNYKVGDTLITTLYHISEDYATFLESVDGAAAANGNPFGQPSPVISSLEGTANALGVFTGLVSFRRNDIVMRN